MARLSNIPDSDLAIRLSQGNLNSLSLLIDRYQKPLIRYVQRLGCREAEDIVQETFIKMYRNINSYVPSRKFSSWLYRIAHNTAISKFRSLVPTLPFADYLDSLIGYEDNDMNNFVLGSNQVDSCLDELKPRLRSVVVLYYLEEKSYSEISDILRLPIGTIGARLSRAKKILRSICQKTSSKTS